MDSWSEVEHFKADTLAETASDKWWAMKSPLIYAIDVVAGIRGEKVSNIADMLKVDRNDIVVSSSLKTAFLSYTKDL